MEACSYLGPLLALLLVQLASSGAQSRATLEILPQGEKQSKSIGSSFLLKCQPKVADHKLITDIQWIDPENRSIENRNKIPPGLQKPTMYTELNPDNSLSLFFNSLSENQAGKYICRAQYAATELLTRDVEIETIVAITWDNAPLNQFPILGEDFAIKCQVRARPSPTVDWLYNGDVIRTNDHYVIETHALRIKNVKESDDGIYTCRASVPQTGQLEERNIRVEVHIKPTIEEFENTLFEVVEGEPANIVCNGAGKPPPKFSWVKSLSKEDLSKADRFMVNEESGALVISSVRREDSSEYQCSATNAAGVATTNIQVNVIVKPKIMEFVNMTVAQDGRVTLACKASGRPAPSITFRKHTSEKPYASGAQIDDDRIVLHNRPNGQDETIGELVIDHALRSNDGMYECIANNKGGMAFKNGHLTVEFPPTFESMSNYTYWSWENRPINLTCIAESIPNATIRWTYFGEQRVENDPQIKVFGHGPVSSLLITPLDRRYYTQYRCTASNKHGEAYKLLELREAQRPTEVRQVNMKETTATSIIFDIIPPEAEPGLPIKTIAVQWKKFDENWNSKQEKIWAVGPHDMYIIEKLEPSTTYEFRFAASNEAGRANWGMQKKFTTTSRSAPGAVRFVHSADKKNYIMSHYHDRYNLQYLSPPDNGERIDYYNIKWCETVKYTGDQWDVRENTCHEKTETKQDTWLLDLNSNTYYRVEVSAHNLLGLGPASNITIKTTKGNTSNASVLAHQGSIISSAAIIGIVVAVLIIIMLITDALLCCTNKSGIIYYMCERRRKPVDEEDAKLGSLYGWRFPLPYCDQKMANVAGVTAIQESGSGKSTITLVKHTAIDEKEPLKEEKKITPIIDNGVQRESSVTFDGKRSISKTGFNGKDSAV